MQNLTDNNFHAERVKPGFMLADFWAVWCPPCKAMNPTLDKVADEFPSVNFVKVNTTENPELTSEYKIQSIPFFILFKDGEIVQKRGGLMDQKTFSDWLKEGGV